MTELELVKEKILKAISSKRIKVENWDDETVKNSLKALIFNYSRGTSLTEEEKESILLVLFNKFRRMDLLEPYLEDPDITDILINGNKDSFIEKNGTLINIGKIFSNEEDLVHFIHRICEMMGREVNYLHPLLDGRLIDGSRVAICLPPVSTEGPVIAIRKFSKKVFTLEDLLRFQTIDEKAKALLTGFIDQKKNLFLSGNTGSGKTTLLSILCGLCEKKERLVIIEDTREISLKDHENLVSLEARISNSSGVSPISLRDLVKMSLRLRPDRIVLGEVRGAEALDMLQAMNTGHKGVLSTGHANSALDMLYRLETLCLFADSGLSQKAIRRQIGSAIDVVIHLEKNGEGKRMVKEMVEVKGWIKEEPDLERIYIREEV